MRVAKSVLVLSLTALGALALTAAACGDDEDACTAGEYQCNGDVLEECKEGAFEQAEDCAAQGLMCHAAMGHCMAMMGNGGGGAGSGGAGSGGN